MREEARSALGRDHAEHMDYHAAERQVLDTLARYLVAHFLDGLPVPRSVVAVAFLPNERHTLESILPEIAADMADAAPHCAALGQRDRAAEVAALLRNADAVLHTCVRRQHEGSDRRAAKTERLRALRAEIDAATPAVSGRVAVRRPRTPSVDDTFHRSVDYGPLEVWEVRRENSQYWYLVPCVLARNEPPPQDVKIIGVKVPKRTKDPSLHWQVYVPSTPPNKTA